jgi:demethylmenaquinone methyltransferase/2-methoxy-6-polyprenyl-1,4-benzoquinol methylase
MKTKKAGMQDLITFREANAEHVPFGDESFDAVTIAFGLRNIQDREGALVDFLRVTKPKGCFVCLEFSQPVNRIFSSMYSFYLTRFVPAVSGILGSDPGAYRYLGETIKDFPTPLLLSRMIESAGWRNVSFEALAGGIVAIHRAEKQ